MNSNRVIAIIILSFCALFLYFAWSLPPSVMPGDLGSKLFPMLTLTALAVLSVGLLFLKEKKIDETSEEATEKKRLEGQSMKQSMAFFAVFIAGVALVRVIGFFPGIFLALTTMLVMAGWKLFPKAIVFSVIVVGGVFMVFSTLLRIPLPRGILFM